MAARRRRKQQDNTIGYFAFLLGIIIAIIAGLVYAAGALDTVAEGTVALVLVVLGLVVGFLNLMDRDYTTFLLAVIALTAAGASGASLVQIPYVGLPVARIVYYIGIFVVPAAVVVALKVIWDQSRL